MKEKRITEHDMIEMNHNEWKFFLIALKLGTWRLLGIPWKKHVSVYRDIRTGDLVFNYE